MSEPFRKLVRQPMRKGKTKSAGQNFILSGGFCGSEAMLVSDT